MRRLLVPFCSILLIAAAAQSAEENAIFAPGAILEKLAGDFKFTEGPACDTEGNVYFTDQPNDRIMIWSVDGKLSTFMQPCGRSNGLCFDPQGHLIACADEHHELWSIDAKTKAVTVLAKEYQGKPLNGPNDVWVSPASGGIYVTDPWYKRDYWQGDRPQELEAVYYLAPGQKNLIRVIDDMVRPNGIIGSPDGKTLYVSDIEGKKTFVYDINSDGSLTNKKLFCEVGSDGMTLDDAGNIYLTNKLGVLIFDKTGKLQLSPKTGESWTANVCFGGKDRQTLFVTAAKSLYAIRTKTRGVGSQ